MFWSLVTRFLHLRDYDHVRALRNLPPIPEAPRMTTRPLQPGHPTRSQWLTPWLVHAALAHRHALYTGARYE